MDLDDVRALTISGETDRVEYKQSLAELDKLGKALCGQLNAAGGYGFIGITDSGKIVGTQVGDSTKKKLTTFKGCFDPWPPLTIEYVSLPDTDKCVIVFECQKLEKEGPYTFRGKPYLKTPSGIKAMPSARYKKLLLDHSDISKLWETLPAIEEADIDALDHAEILKTFKVGIEEKRIPEDEWTEDIKEILTHFDLLQGNRVNHAAMVLFAKKLPADYSQCFLRMGRFADETLDEVIDSRQVRGNAFQLFREAQAFVRRHLPVSSRYDPNQYERIDEVALPLLAVREAIINAICHRDYANQAGDISLYIYNDILEIHNVGHLYGGLTVEELSVKHPSRRRNERIAQVFHARKFIDRFGSGTRRMVRMCAERDLPAPEFSEETDGFQVRFYMSHEAAWRARMGITHSELSQRQVGILQILERNGALSTKELHGRLINPPTERHLRDEMKKLSEMNFIRAEGATTNKKWLIIS